MLTNGQDGRHQLAVQQWIQFPSSIQLPKKAKATNSVSVFVCTTLDSLDAVVLYNQSFRLAGYDKFV